MLSGSHGGLVVSGLIAHEKKIYPELAVEQSAFRMATCGQLDAEHMNFMGVRNNWRQWGGCGGEVEA